MSGFDPEQYRRESVEQWDAAAAGWARRDADINRFAEPVADWLLQALSLQRGQRVLDLAAGLGEIGIRAAGLVGADGGVVIGDQAEAMVSAAAEKVRELGLANVEVRRIDAEWIDLRVGSLDAIVCRWGLMLMADPDAALRECRRVLRPGGKLALAVWAAPERNPWASAPGAVLVKRGLMPMPNAQAEGFTPGMFALADEDALRERLSEAGFTEIELQALPFSRRQASFEEFWETTLDISPGFHGTVMSRSASEIEQIRGEVASSLEPFTAPDGTVEVPATSLVASASA